MSLRSPAAAFAWEFRGRHRWGFAAVVGYLMALPASDLAFTFHEEWHFVLVVTVPLSAAVYYLMAVFSFGFSGDLAARRSVYPPRMFTLPVGAGTLAGWPMLYGALFMAALWTAARTFGFWPAGLAVPVVWPGVMLMAAVAWAQAMVWTSYGVRGARVVAIVLWLSVLAIVAQLALFYEVREGVMLAILGPQLPLAFLVARAGVARARRGDVRDWGSVFAGFNRTVRWRRRPVAFESASRAQAWFEWQASGRALPALVAMLLPFELVLLFAARDAPALIFTILIIVLLTPPFMAIFVAAAARKSHPEGEGYGLSTFIATRPVTSAALVGAKLRMAMRSTLVTWLLVFVAVPVALDLSDTGQVVLELARRVGTDFGMGRGVVLAALVFGALAATTWKQLVQSLYVGLSGRAWLVKSSVFLALFTVTIAAPLLVWLSEHLTVLLRLWDAVPWVLAGLAFVKLGTAGWIATRLYDARLVGDRALLTGAACWSAVVLGVYGLIVWILAAPLVPSYLVLLVSLLATPLARVSAAPLALAWNRHR